MNWILSFKLIVAGSLKRDEDYKDGKGLGIRGRKSK
jgi:hypothetical protein